jgi:hypothetical protein
MATCDVLHLAHDILRMACISRIHVVHIFFYKQEIKNSHMFTLLPFFNYGLWDRFWCCFPFLACEDPYLNKLFQVILYDNVHDEKDAL